MPRLGRAAGKAIGSRVPRTDWNRGPPVAGEAGASREKGTDEELPGSTLTEEAGRRAVALGHGYGGWGAAREDADLTGSTRFEAAADAIDQAATSASCMCGCPVTTWAWRTRRYYFSCPGTCTARILD
jgi:hypothetical protein